MHQRVGGLNEYIGPSTHGMVRNGVGLEGDCKPIVIVEGMHSVGGKHHVKLMHELIETLNVLAVQYAFDSVGHVAKIEQKFNEPA